MGTLNGKTTVGGYSGMRERMELHQCFLKLGYRNFLAQIQGMSRKESLGSCGRSVFADERPAAWNLVGLRTGGLHSCRITQ